MFLRQYPAERPLLYVTGQWRYHRHIRPHVNEVLYEAFFPWRAQSRLPELVSKLQEEFTREPPLDKSIIDQGLTALDTYLKRVEQWRTNPNSLPPPPPRVELETVLKTF